MLKSRNILPQFDITIVKVLQLLGDFVPQTPYRGFALGPLWGTSPRPLQFAVPLSNCAGTYGPIPLPMFRFSQITITKRTTGWCH